MLVLARVRWEFLPISDVLAALAKEYLTFAAITSIPAGTELLWDYDCDEKPASRQPRMAATEASRELRTRIEKGCSVKRC